MSSYSKVIKKAVTAHHVVNVIRSISRLLDNNPKLVNQLSIEYYRANRANRARRRDIVEMLPAVLNHIDCHGKSRDNGLFLTQFDLTHEPQKITWVMQLLIRTINSVQLIEDDDVTTKLNRMLGQFRGLHIEDKLEHEAVLSYETFIEALLQSDYDDKQRFGELLYRYAHIMATIRKHHGLDSEVYKMMVNEYCMVVQRLLTRVCSSDEDLLELFSPFNRVLRGYIESGLADNSFSVKFEQHLTHLIETRQTQIEGINDMLEAYKSCSKIQSLMEKHARLTELYQQTVIKLMSFESDKVRKLLNQSKPGDDIKKIERARSLFSRAQNTEAVVLINLLLEIKHEIQQIQIEELPQLQVNEGKLVKARAELTREHDALIDSGNKLITPRDSINASINSSAEPDDYQVEASSSTAAAGSDYVSINSSAELDDYQVEASSSTAAAGSDLPVAEMIKSSRQRGLFATPPSPLREEYYEKSLQYTLTSSA